MVGVSREYSWYAKGWELLSGRFSTLKGKLAIQKEFKNCTHIYIYFQFWWVKQKDALWWEDLKSTTVFSPGSAPRWHLIASQELCTEEKELKHRGVGEERAWGVVEWGGGVAVEVGEWGCSQKTNRGLRFNERIKNEERRRFAVLRIRCSSNMMMQQQNGE